MQTWWRTGVPKLLPVKRVTDPRLLESTRESLRVSVLRVFQGRRRTADPARFSRLPRVARSAAGGSAASAASSPSTMSMKVVKARMKTVGNIRKLTKAMKMARRPSKKS